MKKTNTFLQKSILLCCILLCFFAVSCKKEDTVYYEIEDTIALLESALEQEDLEMLAMCFDENIQKVLSGGSKLISGITGVDVAAVSDVLLGLMGMQEENGLPEGYDFSLTVAEKEYTDKTHCNVTVQAAMTAPDGQQDHATFQLPMVENHDGRKIKLTLSDLGLS